MKIFSLAIGSEENFLPGKIDPQFSLMKNFSLAKFDTPNFERLEILFFLLTFFWSTLEPTQGQFMRDKH